MTTRLNSKHIRLAKLKEFLEENNIKYVFFDGDRDNSIHIEIVEASYIQMKKIVDYCNEDDSVFCIARSRFYIF